MSRRIFFCSKMCSKKRLIHLKCILVSFQPCAEGIKSSVSFIKRMPYYQVVKDLTLTRCIAQLSSENKIFSDDAARTANAMREWMPYNIDSGDIKINAIINSFKSKENYFYNDSGVISNGYMINCLRLYHSAELDKLSKEVIDNDPFSNWYQDNAK
ncbi:T6SS amidase immunity protein Tai4 family protein [Winslowiella toletana]|uniref:T6SS amidase immunity protein Tai4 family protein n=1 Tax=Winslowiella toletana TaxID=92490 RepID=UPI0028BEE346|nr:T6SS amidase immunity protein Tai4 family protein [Winslowiella toletana]WNN44933.1 T6SS amidase immunity protein Tai4 family protein [Winslowiella toletana]